MSLYDGLDDKASGHDANISGWGSSSGFKLLQPQLQTRKSMTQKRKQTGSLAPVIDLKKPTIADQDGEVRFNQLTGRIEKVHSVAIGDSPFLASEPSFTGVTDEYDPIRPNDYEKMIKVNRDKRNKDKEEARKKEIEERERRRKERHKELGYRDEYDDSDDGRISSRRPGGTGGAAIAPPPSLIENIEDDDNDSGEPMMPSGDVGKHFGMGGTVAAKMMARMGYKAGKGLGKEGQGMALALQVEKTSKRGGKIIHEKDIPIETASTVASSNADLLKNPSKVVLLRNMVGPGEVDEDLEPETAEECTKYGSVTKCLIFEMPEAEDEEAVRIFVEFDKMDSAIKAVIDLNGRFFGGRTVKAGFYNLDKFRRFELAELL